MIEETQESPVASSPDVQPGPEVIYPTCPGCGADPLELKRLRYDFEDGVIVETLFCAKQECRVAIGAQIVGVERPQKKR